MLSLSRSDFERCFAAGGRGSFLIARSELRPEDSRISRMGRTLLAALRSSCTDAVQTSTAAKPRRTVHPDLAARSAGFSRPQATWATSERRLHHAGAESGRARKTDEIGCACYRRPRS